MVGDMTGIPNGYRRFLAGKAELPEPRLLSRPRRCNTRQWKTLNKQTTKLLKQV